MNFKQHDEYLGGGDISKCSTGFFKDPSGWGRGVSKVERLR